jgi:hypothetical protein
VGRAPPFRTAYCSTDALRDFDDPLPYAKLFVYTTGRLAYGFYLEATGKRNDDNKYQHWRNFRERLKTNGRFRQTLAAAMAEHDLFLADYYRRDGTGGALGGQFRSHNGRLRWSPPGQPKWRDSSLDELVDRVTSLSGEHWIDLHAFAEMDSVTAVNMGRKILEPMVTVLRALIPVYQGTIARAV